MLKRATPQSGVAATAADAIRVRTAGLAIAPPEAHLDTMSHGAPGREAGISQAGSHASGVRLPVLLYHHVGPARPGISPELTVSPERFERQVRWLARRGYTAIRPSDWLAWRRRAIPLPPKPVLLTFDDGYEDLAEHALPVLYRHGFTAAVYIVTGLLGKTNQWDPAAGPAAHCLMTAGQIREWDRQGIEFGAHSRTHADLTAATPSRLEEEISGSADDLAALLGKRPVSFAYPFGHCNPEVRESVARIFDLAFTAREGLNDAATDPHQLRRTMVQPGDMLFNFAWRVRLGWDPLTRLRGRVRLRSRIRNAARRLRGKAQ